VIPLRHATAGPVERGKIGAMATRRAVGLSVGFAGGLLAIAAVALVVRVVFTLAVAPEVQALPEPSDAGAYHLLANDLADGRGYIRPYDRALVNTVRPTAEYPPVFPAALSVVARFGGTSVDAQRIAMCFVGTGTVVLIGLLGRRVAGEGVGLLSAALAALYPMLFQSDAALMAETPYVFLVTAVLLLAWRAREQPTPARFAALGLTIGAAALTRAEGALFVPLLLIPLAFTQRDTSARRAFQFAAVGVGAALLVVLPWTIRNYARFDRLVPLSTNLGSALDGANCPEMFNGPRTGLWRYSPGCFEGFLQSELAVANEATVAQEHRDQGVRYARRHLGDVPRVMAVRWLRTFGFYDPKRQVAFESLEWRRVRWQTLGMRTYWALLPFAAVGTLALVRQRRWMWPLLSTAGVVTLTTVLTYGNQRFRIAVEPALLVLAATGMLALARRLPRLTTE
jgi:hypothetical protein